MIVVICAAGESKRIKGLTKNKLLLEVNGKMLLKRVLDNVVQKNVKKIVMVIGYDADKIKKAVGNEHNGVKIEYVFNDHYKTKGNMSSLYAAKDHIDDDLVFTTGDLIIMKENAKRIFNYNGTGILVDTREEAKTVSDVLKFSLVNGKFKEVSKKMEPEKVYAVACGLYKFKLDAAKKFYKIMEEHFKKRENDLPWNIPVEELFQVHEVKPVLSDGSFCMDIDTPEDFKKVSEELKKKKKKKD